MEKKLIAQEWLDLAPMPNEMEYFDSERKARYIPYEIVIGKLNFLTQGHTWNSKNFSHFFFTMPDGTIKVSGSIEISIKYNKIIGDKNTDEIVRTISGAATFTTLDYEGNEHWAATVKSLAIVNAAQLLGNTFGFGLNEALKRTVKEQGNKIKDTLKNLPKT